MFGGLTHEPAVRLAAPLIELAPGRAGARLPVRLRLGVRRGRGQDVPAVLGSLGRPAKRRLLTWRGGYHGDTFQPMSVCDPEGGMHALWRGVLPEQVFAPAPPAGFDHPRRSLRGRLAAADRRHADELAAVIVEPVVQGAGGMRFHHPGYLHALRELSDAHDVLLIFDEIATVSAGRGKCSLPRHAGVTPDVMCLGKAITGGYLSMAATLCTPRVAAGISRGELARPAPRPDLHGQPAGRRGRERLDRPVAGA